MTHTISYFLPPSIVFGAGAIRDIGEHLNALNSRRPLIVTDEGVTREGVLSQAVTPLDSGGPSG